MSLRTPSFNRTILELKYKITEEQGAELKTFNRTILELKCGSLLIKGLK